MFRRACFVALGAALAVAFGGCESEEEALLRALGEGCLLNSDCEGALVCVFRRCHAQCAADEDCVGLGTGRCIEDGESGSLVCEGANGCPSGSATCGDAAGACETEIDSDPQNCGACGRSCLGGQCIGGVCAPEVLASNLGPWFGGMTVADDSAWVLTADSEGDPMQSVGAAIVRVPLEGGGPTEAASFGLGMGTTVGSDGAAIFWGSRSGSEPDFVTELLRLPFGSSDAAPVAGCEGFGEGCHQIVAAGDRYFCSTHGGLRACDAGGTVGVLPEVQVRGVVERDGTVYAAVGEFISKHVLRVMALDGGELTELAAIDDEVPYGAAVDATHVYFASANILEGMEDSIAKIFRVPRAGGVVESLFSGQGWIEDLVIDDDGKLYFAWHSSTLGRRIMALDVTADGATPIPIALGLTSGAVIDGGRPTYLALSASHVVWLDTGAGTVLRTNKW